jgi:hypothetical protein
MTIQISVKYNTVEKMHAGVKSVIGRAKSWRNDVQQLAVATLNHAHVHGDWTILRDLVEGVSQSDGVNKTALKNWAEHFTGAELTAVKDPKTSKSELKFLFPEGKGVKDIDVEAAAAVEWFKYRNPPADKSKDLDEIREALVKMLLASVKTEKVTVAQAELLIQAYDNQLTSIREVDAAESEPVVEEVKQAA